MDPIVVDVVLVQRDQTLSFSPRRVLPRSSSLKERYPFCWNTMMDREELGVGVESERVVERWVVQYESRKPTRDSNSGSRRSSNTSLHALYKKSTLLLRSLYATVRLLPAYKIFRELNSNGKICAFTLAHRVSTFVEPFTSKEEAKMLKFGFTPVDTSSGRLCLSVMYCPSVSDVSSEPSTPMSPQVITDYVGSPMADPLRRYPSLPVARVPLPGTPSSLPSSRRHSWSYDHCRASSPSNNCSPSPTYSESNTSVSLASFHCYPPNSLPPHPSGMSLLHKKNTNFDDYNPSPSFSPSPSPSPPIYNLGSLASKALLRSESAPVCIPNTKDSDSPGYTDRRNLPPSSPRRGLRNVIQTCTTTEKLFSLGKDESQKYSGAKIVANSLPQISFSRSSSRSYQDDFDDTDFTCPFDVDDDDITDPGSRAESFDHGQIAEVLEAGKFLPIRKSQDAAVGALVHMLKKAAPLHQDFSTSEHLSPGTRPETLSNNSIQEPNQVVDGLNQASIMSTMNRKTTADALEEFYSYREMKNLLLMRGSKQQI